jgi:hypothetical protein
MIKLTSAIKGLITGIVMMALLLLMYNSLDARSQRYILLVVPIIYALGIVWAIFSFSKSNNIYSFGKLFQEGFKCFIIATLIITAGTFVYYKIFYSLHPQLLDDYGKTLKDYLTQTQKDKTPQQLDELVDKNKKYYVVTITSYLIFIYLIIGTVVSAATAGMLSLQKKN